MDFFHAKEKLVEFARTQWSKSDERSAYLEKQLERLRNNDLDIVLQDIRSCRARSPEAKQAKQKLIDYYLEHEDGMQYKTYRDQGLLIGSRPIEAAHRSVIQQRMKRSGQKWSKQGAQAMANLRCYRCSGAWQLVRKIIQAA